MVFFLVARNIHGKYSRSSKSTKNLIFYSFSGQRKTDEPPKSTISLTADE